jgi:hypothetical protein
MNRKLIVLGQLTIPDAFAFYIIGLNFSAASFKVKFS